VFIGVAYAGEWGTQSSTVSVDRYEFDGSRTEIKERIARRALEDLLDGVQKQGTADQ
jgi:nicotinamide-nucleotide amidase